MKQVSRILEEVNFDLSRIRLVKCVGCHNEEGWIEYNLANNYDEFDIIRVVEGAVEGRPNSTEDGHSTDKTIEIIKNFPDPDNKIELITLKRSFKSLEEQKQLFLELACEGDWLFIADCVSGDRCVPVKINNEIDILSLEEIYNHYINNGFQPYLNNNKEVIDTNNLSTLSVTKFRYPEHKLEVSNRGKIKLSDYFRSKLTKKQIKILDQYESGTLIFSQKNNAVVKSIRKKLNSIKKVVAEWTKVSKITRSKTSKDMMLIRSKFGETCVTKDHKVATRAVGAGIEYNIPENLNQDMIQISSVDSKKYNNISLINHIKNNNLFVKDGKLFYNSSRKDQRDFYIENFLEGERLLDFCWLLGYYAAEGSIDEEKCANFRVCGSKDSVDKCKSILEKISHFTSNYGFSAKKNNSKVCYLGITSSIIIRIFADMFGFGCYNKRVPRFLFDLDDIFKQSFLNGYNCGDGSVIRTNAKNKYISTSVSKKLIGGVCLLSKQLEQDVSITFRDEDKFYDNFNRKGPSYFVYQDVIKRRKSQSIVVKNCGETKDFVYDLVVPRSSNFCDAVGMVVVHNCDEFYMEGDISRVRNAIRQHPMASEFVPTFLHFYRDMMHIRSPNPDWNAWHQRIIRYRAGSRFHTHPVVTLADGKCSYFTPEIQQDRYMIPIYIYHYGHIKSPEFHKAKAEFYRKELVKFEGRGGNAAIEFDSKLDEFLNYKEDLNEILYFDGQHPEVLNSHSARKSHDGFYGVSNKKGIKNWKLDIAYKEKMPTIPLWMLDNWNTKRMEPFYNNINI